MANQNGKEKDFVFFPYDPNHEKAIKIDFSGNIKLNSGVKATVLGSKGSSQDGNTKFIKVFKQVGVLFKGDDNKFTGNLHAPEVAPNEKSLIGWLNDQSDTPNIAGYQNDSKPKEDEQKTQTQPSNAFDI